MGNTALDRLRLASLAPLASHLAFWFDYLVSNTRREWPQPSLHIAVFREPYRTLVLQGRKTIESRFARTRHPLYQVVRTGDVILIKDVGGPISGIVLADRVEPIGNIPPDEAEALYYAQTDEFAMVV